MEKEAYKLFKVKMKKIHVTRYIILFFLAVFLINGFVENVVVNNRINKFMERGDFVKEEVDPLTKLTTRYYSVSRETSFEKDGRESITRIGRTTYIGQRGDIITTKEAPFPNIPVIYQLVSYFFGGHAGIVTSTEEYLECVGNQDDNNCVRYNENDWFYIRSNTIGLRIKNASESDYEGIVKKAEEKIGKPYNYTFVFNTHKSYYCTDLVTTSVKEYNKKLDPNDSFVTTVNDLVASQKTYLFYYHYVDSDNVMHVYYLE